jgi:tRNA A58 N-methylase Trm61
MEIVGMELWEILDKRWKIAKIANGIDDDEVQHQAYLKASEEEKIERA